MFPARVDINRSPALLGTFEAALATELNILIRKEGREDQSLRGRYEAKWLLALVVAKTKRVGEGIYSESYVV